MLLLLFLFIIFCLHIYVLDTFLKTETYDERVVALSIVLILLVFFIGTVLYLYTNNYKYRGKKPNYSITVTIIITVLLLTLVLNSYLYDILTKFSNKNILDVYATILFFNVFLIVYIILVKMNVIKKLFDSLDLPDNKFYNTLIDFFDLSYHQYYL